jgi:cytochrome c-type biogenesis protein CcsB
MANAAISMQMPPDAASRGSSFSEDLERAPAPPAAVTVSGGGAVTMSFSQGGTQGALPVTDEERLLQGLDDLSYRSLLLGFGFLTVGIISGAVWANEAWGNYWSWDPKETWALITWLVYAGYLHTRLQLKWEARKSAMLGAFGFLVTWVCYIGVNLMGIGLHSYGFFLK